MLNKVSGIARTLYIVLAIVAGVIALGGLDVALILVLLGLIAGISMPQERMVLAFAAVIGLPIVASAVATLPVIGTKLSAVLGNLQLGIAGALVTALAIYLYKLAMEGVTGLTATSK